MSFLVALALQMAEAMPAEPQRFDLARLPKTGAALSPLRLCGEDGDAEVVICADRADRYRLPLPIERDPAADNRAADLPGGMAALTPGGPCGLFAGQRSCTRREAAAYGYGNGRDPITILLKAGKRLIDGD